MSTFLTTEKLTEVPVSERFDENKLLNYLRTKIDIFPRFGSLKVYKINHGQSNPAYLLQCKDFKVALRKKPFGKLLQSIDAIQREYRVMSALRNSRVPVPKMYHLCTDLSIIGEPFIICEFIKGRVFTKPNLPNLKPQERFVIYHEMNRVLSAIHSVNVFEAKLKDFALSTEDNISRWNKQFNDIKTTNTASTGILNEFSRKINEYNDNKRRDKSVFGHLIHGNYRLENIIFDEKSFRILAVLDWELANIGDALSDLSSFCYWTYHSEPIKTENTGIPNELNFIQSWMNSLNVRTASDFIANFEFPIKDWNFYLAFSVYRSIILSMYRYINRKTAKPIGFDENSALFSMAQQGMTMLNKANIYDAILLDKSNKLPHYFEQYKQQFDNPNFYDIRTKLLYFVNAYCRPFDKQYELFYSNPRNKWRRWPKWEILKQKARELKLWNLFLPSEYTESPGLTNLQYVPIAEIMGGNGLASRACNCSAPDTGNMEVLAKYGNQYQKDKWLIPLMEGKIRSCFGMTEPAVASSDARNIECSMIKSSDGKHYYINGRKWWSSGAMSPDCKICILMGKTNVNASTYFQQSMFIVELNRPGVKIVRHLKVFGYDHNPGGHGEIIFDNVKVPIENLILGQGKGFEIAQGRLGPGRIHHCMRTIGLCEAALSMMKRRCLTRYAFGKHIYKFQSLQHDIAKSRVDIDMLRLLVLQTAALMDKYGNKSRITRKYISMIKVKAANIACEITDKAIQCYGGMGVCQDTPLSHMYAFARTLRLADGADAVHSMVVARNELLKAKL